MTKKQLGTHIKKLRLLKGYSQRKLATLAGMSTSGPLSLLEQGRKNIGLDGLITILTLLESEIAIKPADPNAVTDLKPEYLNL